MFDLQSDYQPAGDQPKAIKELLKGYNSGKQQTLLGVTGSGKTFTIANVIKEVNRPVLVLSHNKTLAAQLYNEFKQFFPNNKVCFFISYYDYYQPESYLPITDTYIEKDVQINEKIEQLRLEATASLLSRDDVIIVASVSAIYGLGSPETFEWGATRIYAGQELTVDSLTRKLVDMQYEVRDADLKSGSFRIRGNVLELIEGAGTSVLRLEFGMDKLESISELHPISFSLQQELSNTWIFPARHYLIPEKNKERALVAIEQELKTRQPQLGVIEAYRLEKRTNYDLEMIRTIGYCKGIENYSMHFDGRQPGQPPYTLLDYFKAKGDFMLVIDESHVSLPQVRGMYEGDCARKLNLIEHGFRLPSAIDNRPLRWTEFENYLDKAIFVSATPADYELAHSGQVVEQIIRPTGLIDPEVIVRPGKDQVQNMEQEARNTIAKGFRVLITTLTKRLAEDLTSYLMEQGLRAKYMHSEIDTMERTRIIQDLRLGKFDVLVGINLLREGLDIPEVALVGILDADKEGFLRNARSLIQTIGRAARNSQSQVILYADKMTGSIKQALAETNRRRKIQQAYNTKHGITPQSIIKQLSQTEDNGKKIGKKKPDEIRILLIELEAAMQQAAEDLDFESAIEYREQIRMLKTGKKF
jgi:excinuclease ABC subunit B